jgi:hypothetical protein
VAAIRALEGSSLILDGEVAVFDEKLISRFEWLPHRAPAEPAKSLLQGVRLRCQVKLLSVEYAVAAEHYYRDAAANGEVDDLALLYEDPHVA